MGYYADVGEGGRGEGGNINHLIFIMSKEISASQAEEESNKFKTVQYTRSVPVYTSKGSKNQRGLKGETQGHPLTSIFMFRLYEI
jgi:hypothetical protein